MASTTGAGYGYGGQPAAATGSGYGYQQPQQQPYSTTTATRSYTGGGGGLMDKSRPTIPTGTRYEDSMTMKIFYVLSAIFIPPLAVGVKTGDPCETVINVLWWICGWIPACIHAAMVAFTPTRCSCYPETAMAIPPGDMIMESMGDVKPVSGASSSSGLAGQQYAGAGPSSGGGYQPYTGAGYPSTSATTTAAGTGDMGGGYPQPLPTGLGTSSTTMAGYQAVPQKAV